MSEIKNVGYIRMALNNIKCHHLMPLHFKGLTLIHFISLSTASNVLAFHITSDFTTDFCNFTCVLFMFIVN